MPCTTFYRAFTESAGAFGSKEDYNALARDTADLDNIRRNLADQLEQMASLQDAQVARLTAQLKSQPSTASHVHYTQTGSGG